MHQETLAVLRGIPEFTAVGPAGLRSEFDAGDVVGPLSTRARARPGRRGGGLARTAQRRAVMIMLMHRHNVQV